MTLLVSSVGDGPICDHNIFIFYTPTIINYAPRNIHCINVTLDNRHNFIVQGSGFVLFQKIVRAGTLIRFPMNKRSSLFPLVTD